MKLSQVMKTLLVTALVAGGAALAVQPSPALAAKKKTNVLLFLTDDTGMDQLELYGYNSVPGDVPNSVEIAKAGVAG